MILRKNTKHANFGVGGAVPPSVNINLKIL